MSKGMNNQEIQGTTSTADTAPVHPFVIRPYYERDGITIYNADCRKVLPFLGTFDLLLTDPPYGITNKTKRGGVRSPGKYHTRSELWDVPPDRETIGMMLDAARNGIIWGGNYFADMLPPTHGWLYWHKDQPLPNRADGELAWTTFDAPLRAKFHRYESGAGRIHDTQKPVAVMAWCLKLAGDIESVVDTFVGSGTTLVAAKLAGIKAVGIEINEKYCEAAVKRLAQGVLPFDEAV